MSSYHVRKRKGQGGDAEPRQTDVEKTGKGMMRLGANHALPSDGASGAWAAQFARLACGKGVIASAGCRRKCRGSPAQVTPPSGPRDRCERRASCRTGRRLMKYILAVDQSTSATKALLFDTTGTAVAATSISHRQRYPQPGWRSIGISLTPSDWCSRGKASVRMICCV